MIKGSNRVMTMETYLRRTYALKKAAIAEQDDFPFWDYRSRRGAFSSSNSSFASSGSSCDGSSISSISTRSETGSESVSISEHSDTDSLMPCEQQKMCVQFITDSSEIQSLEDIYQPIINWIDPDLHILKITDQSECLDNEFASLPASSRLPSIALMVFLQEDGAVGFERIQTVRRYFEKSPWKFHHSEQVNRGAINPYPYNSQDFYYTAEDLPLWAVRQVHTGKEFFRAVLFVSEGNWQSMMQFYKLVLGAEPDMKREDFCLFTVSSFPNFDIQLALKKLKGDTKPRALDSVKLQFRLNDISNIMSLLPNVCRPLSDTRWQTTDSDGNMVVLETPRFYANSTFIDRCSLSERSSASGRSSRTGSFSQRNQPEIRKDQQRASLEARRRVSPPVQRSRSQLVDQRVMERIRNDNVVFKQQAMDAIKEQHTKLQNNTKLKTNASIPDENTNTLNQSKTEEIEPEPKIYKSFYV